MAGSKLNRRVRASTIIEVVIAMVIIVVIFSMAMMIYTNVERFSLSAKKLRARAILDSVLLMAEENAGNVQPSSVIDDCVVNSEIKAYGDNPLLLIIKLSAYDQNQQKITEVQKIIRVQNE